MNPILKQLVEERKCNSLDGKSLIDISATSISNVEGELIYKAVQEVKAQTSVETGLAYGTSAIWICEALQKTAQSKHIVIDPMQNAEGTPWKGLGINNLRLAGYESMIEFHEQYSHLALPQLEKSGIKVDFGFIDGFHTFDHTLIDFFYIDRILKVGGILVIDDCNWESIRKVCSFILTNRSYKVWDYVKSDFELTSSRKTLNSLHHFLKKKPSLKSYFQPDHAVYGELLDQISYGGCIAFRKESDDKRLWNHYQEF
ncbi:MAG: class I SAM-dependent methyltransferase [Bacteroidetes bacterium]|nr:MAG: class I SAM-dependent methyltransferase [Bacteroidota bacterium]